MNKNSDIEELIPIMRCPSCKVHGSLEIKDGAYDFNISVPLSQKTIYCEPCNEHYPITDDLIPIMWSDNLKHAFSDIRQTHETNHKPDDAGSNISANIKVYNNISTDYSKYTRQSPVISTRIKNSVEKIFPDNKTGGLFHLDFACGPGHVLKWLKPFSFKQIGLDVSLANLRNVRNSTGCSVICGDACNMPFADDTFSLVTESSALHHILDWKSVITESCRICRERGGIIMDSEPSDIQMDWSPLAVAVFNARFPFYKVLSYFVKNKFVFRNTEQAKINLQAEIHHQPGTGIPLDVLKNTFNESGFEVQIITSPTAELNSRANPNWKSIFLNLLSARNPWNPNYGNFMAIATDYKHKSLIESHQ